MTANLADRVEGLPARIYAHEFTGETGRGGWTSHNGYGIGTEFIRADLVDDAVKALERLVDEFGCSIEQYDRIGPDWTHKDGTEVFEVSTLLDRREFIDEAKAALTRIKGDVT